MDDLWVCSACSLIGDVGEANRHEDATGHEVRRLTDAEQTGVRERWVEEGRDPRSGGVTLVPSLLAYARMRLGGGSLDGPDF